MLEAEQYTARSRNLFPHNPSKSHILYVYIYTVYMYVNICTHLYSSIHICTDMHRLSWKPGSWMAEISKAQERMEATLAEVKNAEEAITQLEVPEVLDLERSPKITGFIVFHCSSEILMHT